MRRRHFHNIVRLWVQHAGIFGLLSFTAAGYPNLRPPESVVTHPFPPGTSGSSKYWLEAGTPSADIFAQRAPRQPCELGFMPGYVEVVHRVVRHSHERLGLWMHLANGSGLWYPPRRVLVCHDSLDLAIHLNHSAAGAWLRPHEPGALISINASNLTCNSWILSKRAKWALFDFARKSALKRIVDTVVLTHHLDIAYANRRVLVGELFALPSSHVYKQKKCPSSDRFRKGRSVQTLRECDCRDSSELPRVDPRVC